MKYRGIFEYEYPTEHKPPVSIDVYLHGDCVKGKIIEWEYRQLEQEPTTKNDCAEQNGCITCSLDDGDDCCRKLFEESMQESTTKNDVPDNNVGKIDRPSVTPQEPQSFKWCTDCREYDQEKHCCHRYSKVIRDTVAEIEQEPKTGHWIGIDEEPHEDYECDKCGYIISTYTANIEPHTEYKYCPNCGCRMIEPQESEDKK